MSAVGVEVNIDRRVSGPVKHERPHTDPLILDLEGEENVPTPLRDRKSRGEIGRSWLLYMARFTFAFYPRDTRSSLSVRISPNFGIVAGRL